MIVSSLSEAGRGEVGKPRFPENFRGLCRAVADQGCRSALAESLQPRRSLSPGARRPPDGFHRSHSSGKLPILLRPGKPQTIETSWQGDGWTEVGFAVGKALPLVLLTAWRLRGQLSLGVQAQGSLHLPEPSHWSWCSLSSEAGCRSLPPACLLLLKWGRVPWCPRLSFFASWAASCMPTYVASLALASNNLLWSEAPA